MSVWYYSDAQRNRLGPVGTEDLAQLHEHGQLAPEVLVWREGLPDWRPWHEVMDEVLGRQAAVAPPAAGFETADASAATTYAPPASPYSAPRAAVDDAGDYRPTAAGDVVHAGFWKRFAALAIDNMVVSAVFFVVLMVLMFAGVLSMTQLGDANDPTPMLAFMAMGYLSYPIFSALYYVGMESSGLQATLGKLAVGIKVTDTTGRRLGRGRALGRWASHLICYFTLYIGYLVAAFTERKQGLHDMVASTLVVDRWAFSPHPERQRRELGTVTVVIVSIVGLLLLGYVAVIAIGVGVGLAGR